MAHTKAGGASRLGRDSQSKRLGVKLFAGQPIKAGMVLVRQRGSNFRAGQNVKKGGDDTLYAQTAGYVKFSRKKVKRYDGRLKLANFVHVVPEASASAAK